MQTAVTRFNLSDSHLAVSNLQQASHPVMPCWTSMNDFLSFIDVQLAVCFNTSLSASVPMQQHLLPPCLSHAARLQLCARATCPDILWELKFIFVSYTDDYSAGGTWKYVNVIRLCTPGIEIHLRSHVLFVLNLVLLQMCAWYLRFWVITYWSGSSSLITKACPYPVLKAS